MRGQPAKFIKNKRQGEHLINYYHCHLIFSVRAEPIEHGKEWIQETYKEWV